MSSVAACRVLVVEDEDDLRHIYCHWLRLAGYDACEARDGLIALRLLDSGLDPGVIVLDLMLPRVDGVAVYSEVRSHGETSDIPIVVVTGSQRDTSVLKVAATLQKPLVCESLVAAVRAANSR